MSNLMKALLAKLHGEIAVAKANIEVYENSAVGVGEHPDLVDAIEQQVEKLAQADEKVQIINKYF